MTDPRFILEPNKVTDEIKIRKTFLLKRDSKDKVVARSLTHDDAVNLLKKVPKQYYNNYLITYNERKIEKRAELFRRLFEFAEPYQINIVAKVETIRSIVTKIILS